MWLRMHLSQNKFTALQLRYETLKSRVSLVSIFAWSASLLTTSSGGAAPSTSATSGPFALVELVDFVQVGVAESIPLTKLAIALQLSSRLNRYRRTTVLRNTTSRNVH